MVHGGLTRVAVQPRAARNGDRLADSSDSARMKAYVLRGDTQAFEALFRDHAPRLHRYFLRNLRDARMAEDLVQQTFLHVHRARNDFDLARPFRPWLFTIAANLMREHRRRARRKPEEIVDPHEAPVVVVQPTTSSVTDRAVRRSVDALPDAQREVVVLHWYEQLSFREISEIVGASLSAVKVRAHRGYEKLRESLGGDA